VTPNYTWVKYYTKSTGKLTLGTTLGFTPGTGDTYQLLGNLGSGQDGIHPTDAAVNLMAAAMTNLAALTQLR
jgi:hypothetical protein